MDKELELIKQGWIPPWDRHLYWFCGWSNEKDKLNYIEVCLLGGEKIKLIPEGSERDKTQRIVEQAVKDANDRCFRTCELNKKACDCRVKDERADALKEAGECLFKVLSIMGHKLQVGESIQPELEKLLSITRTLKKGEMPK